MNYKELKKFCDEKIKEFSEYEKRYKKEIVVAKRFYNNDRNLYQELHERKNELDNRYVIPFLLGLIDEVDLEKDPDYIQVRPGASGGIDIDSDLSPEAKEAVFEYLREKHGEDRVIPVGTYSRLGVASAAKDLLRIAGVSFKDSIGFTKVLDSNESWEKNLEKIKATNPQAYAVYQKHQKILDKVPNFIDKIRQVGKHAGGVAILDRPVYDLIPVERVNGIPVTAFPESAQDQALDEIGIVKFDILGISILDVVASTVDMIDEKIYLIEDDDGIQKAVPQSYIDQQIKEL